MITYKKITNSKSTNYWHNKGSKNGTGGTFIKKDQVPPEVLEKLDMGVPEVEFDDMPDRRRCIFCEGPQQRIRFYNMATIDLCNWHYEHMSLGKVAQQVRELDIQAQKQAEEETRKAEERKAKWHKEHPNGNKKQTELSKMVK